MAANRIDISYAVRECTVRVQSESIKRAKLLHRDVTVSTELLCCGMDAVRESMSSGRQRATFLALNCFVRVRKSFVSRVLMYKRIRTRSIRGESRRDCFLLRKLLAEECE